VASKQSTGSRARRSRQLTDAQNAFRERMREGGYRRLQAWVPSESLDTLHKICERDNLTQSEALARSIELQYRMSQVES
jgi:hypothetical protein